MLNEEERSQERKANTIITLDGGNDKKVELYLRACLHGGGGPQVGEVTCLGEVKK